MKRQPRVIKTQMQRGSATLYLADGSAYEPTDNRSGVRQQQCKPRTIVTGTFQEGDESHALVEIVRDVKNASRLNFLRWENGTTTVSHFIEQDDNIFELPDAGSTDFPDLSLPTMAAQCTGSGRLLDEISCVIGRFVKLRADHLRIVTNFALATWFADCFEAAPVLWVVGPLGSAKTKLLKLMWCFCRRALIAGDLRSASIYKLIDMWSPTLLLDEFEPARFCDNAEIFRVLRSGSVPGVPVFRNGRAFLTYGLKIVASRQPLDDPALISRGVVVQLLPTEDASLPLDETTRRRIEAEFQDRLLGFRLTNYAAVKNFSMDANCLQGLSARMKQIARALAALLLGEPSATSELLVTLSDHDHDARLERMLEPEWLVEETLFGAIHANYDTDYKISEFLVGGIAKQINHRLELQGEDVRISPKKVGAVLKSLGLRTVRLGRWGRGLKMTSALSRRVHAIARHLGIDRRTIATLPGIESGYGGAPCPLCEEFALSGGLKFVPLKRYRDPSPCSSNVGPSFVGGPLDEQNPVLRRSG